MEPRANMAQSPAQGSHVEQYERDVVLSHVLHNGELFIDEPANVDAPFAAVGLHCSDITEQIPYAAFVETDASGAPQALTLQPLLDRFSGEEIVMNYLHQ